MDGISSHGPRDSRFDADFAANISRYFNSSAPHIWVMLNRIVSASKAEMAYSMREEGNPCCLSAMTSSIVKWPFGDLNRYKGVDAHAIDATRSAGVGTGRKLQMTTDDSQSAPQRHTEIPKPSDVPVPNICPAVSVVVPNYNHARFLSKRLESILRQLIDRKSVV